MQIKDIEWPLNRNRDALIAEMIQFTYDNDVPNMRQALELFQTYRSIEPRVNELHSAICDAIEKLQGIEEEVENIKEVIDEG